MKNKQQNGLFFSMTFEFLEIYMPKQAGMSQETIRSYRDALTVFRRYLYEECNISISKFLFEECTKDCLMDFVTHLKANGCKAGTCNQRIAAIRSYLSYAADKDIAIQPIVISASKVPTTQPPYTKVQGISYD